MLKTPARYVALPICLTIGLGSACSRSGDPPDLASYLNQIRATRMSEGAASALRMVASLRSGQTLLEYQKDGDSGRYWPSYASTSCPNPKVDLAEAKRRAETLERQIEQGIEALRPIADLDHSGFVSTQEGDDFRRVVEFGYLAAKVQADGGAGIAAVANAAGVDVATTQETLRRYREIVRAQAGDVASRLPTIGDLK
jgi:Tfp pilus assembly protein PilP